ncbi:hypothetical protein SZ55_4866 [Pseudomonas sp. FeS53a]|nr:hypothetical protein SZ55_4866 [Pseudomonas sp. FeS53a]
MAHRCGGFSIRAAQALAQQGWRGYSQGYPQVCPRLLWASTGHLDGMLARCLISQRN